MDFAIQPAGGLGVMTQETSTDALTDVFLSLTIPLGSFFANPKLGSRLHLLRTMGNTPRTESLIPDYVREALQWLLDIGRITDVNVITQCDPIALPNRINVAAQITQPNGQRVTFNTFVSVV